MLLRLLRKEGKPSARRAGLSALATLAALGASLGSTPVGKASEPDRPAPSLEQPPRPPGTDQITVRDQRMTLNVQGGSLRAVLAAVAERSGIDIRFVGEGDRTIGRQSFADVPLEKGLRQLLRETQYAFVYSGKEPDSKIAHVVVVLGPVGGAADSVEPQAPAAAEIVDTEQIVAEVKKTLSEALKNDSVAAEILQGGVPRAAMPDQQGMERLDEVVRDLSEQLRSQIEADWTQPAPQQGTSAAP